MLDTYWYPIFEILYTETYEGIGIFVQNESVLERCEPTFTHVLTINKVAAGLVSFAHTISRSPQALSSIVYASNYASNRGRNV